MTTVAGDGHEGYAGDGGSALAACLKGISCPFGLCHALRSAAIITLALATTPRTSKILGNKTKAALLHKHRTLHQTQRLSV